MCRPQERRKAWREVTGHEDHNYRRSPAPTSVTTGSSPDSLRETRRPTHGSAEHRAGSIETVAGHQGSIQLLVRRPRGRW